MSTSKTRIIGGNIQYRRFAYLHKRDFSYFGLLDAVNHHDARRHLGSRFHIRQTWLTREEEQQQLSNRNRKWEIVSSIFLDPRSAAFIGKLQSVDIELKGGGPVDGAIFSVSNVLEESKLQEKELNEGFFWVFLYGCNPDGSNAHIYIEPHPHDEREFLPPKKLDLHYSQGILLSDLVRK